MRRDRSKRRRIPRENMTPLAAMSPIPTSREKWSGLIISRESTISVFRIKH